MNNFVFAVIDICVCIMAICVTLLILSATIAICTVVYHNINQSAAVATAEVENGS